MEEQMIELEQSEMARSSDPNYNQICGMVPKTLINRVKMMCLQRDLNQSEAMEAAFRLWLSVEESRKKEEESDRHET